MSARSAGNHSSQKCKEEELGKLQACQSDLGAKECYGIDHPECCHMAWTGYPGDLTWLAGTGFDDLLRSLPIPVVLWLCYS